MEVRVMVRRFIVSLEKDMCINQLIAKKERSKTELEAGEARLLKGPKIAFSLCSLIMKERRASFLPLEK